jgi:hypothetical protein
VNRDADLGELPAHGVDGREVLTRASGCPLSKGDAD